MCLLKVSQKSKKRIRLCFDVPAFRVSWKQIHTPLLIVSSNPLGKGKTCEFSIADVQAAHIQHDACAFREELHVSKEMEDRWMTITYYNHKKGTVKYLHLIADTVHDFKRLNSQFKYITGIVRGSCIGTALTMDDTSREVRQYLTLTDVFKYSRRLNININRQFLEDTFNALATTHQDERGLDFDQFKEFVSTIKARTDMREIWQRHCGPNHAMTFDRFSEFVLRVQCDHHEPAALNKIFKRFCFKGHNRWFPENLNNYLLSKYSVPLVEDGDVDYYNYPLNDYFISSSHNTFLTGRQVADLSSVEGYVRALQRGCKCLEIDLWDGNGSLDADEDEPLVKHGRSFTTAIPFSHVIQTIKRHAFMVSSMPVILSLEVRCGHACQLQAVRILHNVLGSSLLTRPLDDSTILPSPLQLRHKFLIKVKKTSVHDPLTSTEMVSASSNNSTSTPSTTNSFSEDSTSSRRSSFSIRRRNHGIKITPSLSGLGIYFQGIKFRNFSLPELKTFNHVFSLSENLINSMLKDQAKRIAIDKHNRRYLMRVYPSKKRITSSNMLPLPYWKHGVQMVATNWQTYDLAQQLNELLFEGIARQGYCLKHPYLRRPLIRSSRVVPELTPTPISQTLEVEVISAHSLPKVRGKDDVINPFVTFEVFGHSCTVDWTQTSALVRSTLIVSANGFNPTWNEAFAAKITATQEMTFVKFTIQTMHSDGEACTIGQIVHKLSSLKQGYRYLPINDPSGEELVGSTLFVKLIHTSRDTHK